MKSDHADIGVRTVRVCHRVASKNIADVQDGCDNSPDAGLQTCEHVAEQAPELVDGRYLQALVGRVHATQSGTERHHFQIGIFFEEQAALQAGMNGPHLRLHVEQTAVALDSDFEQLRFGVGSPARVAVGVDDFGAGQCEDRLDGLHGVELGAFDRGALRSRDNDAVVALELDRCQIGRGLDEPLDGERHCQHTIGDTDQSTQKRTLRRRVEHLVDRRHLIERKCHARLREMIFGLDLLGELLEASDEIRRRNGRHAHYGICLARNGIAKIAA